MIRIDSYLVNVGYARSRTVAQKLIEAGFVTVDGSLMRKPSALIDEEVEHSVSVTEEFKYVSRGGYKLEGIIEAGHVDVTDKICIDIGASTGGFTDCLLQKGARHVYSVDSGTDQLAPSISANPRVTALEKTNARSLSEEQIPEPADIIVMDVSFISQTLIHETVNRFLSKSGIFISLIKPQFELSRSEIGKGGIVKSKSDRHLAIKRVIASCEKYDLHPQLLTDSSITGGDGNREYTVIFSRRESKNFNLTNELKKLS